MDLSFIKQNFLTRTDRIGIYPGKSIVPDGDLDNYIDGHIEGRKRIGFYCINEDSTVLWSVIDLDNHGKDPKIMDFITRFINTFIKISNEMGFRSYIELSKSGGVHIWCFYKDPIESKYIRSFLHRYIQLIGELSKLPKYWIKDIEVFPKQDELTPTNPFGNFIWLPFFGGQDKLGGGVHDKRTVFYNKRRRVIQNPSFTQIDKSDLEQISEKVGLESFVLPKTKKTDNKSKSNAFKMCETGVKRGKRNTAAFEILRHLKYQGVEEKWTRQIIRDWNKKNQPPLSVGELDKVVQSIFSEKGGNWNKSPQYPQYPQFQPRLKPELLTSALKKYLNAVSTTTDAPDEFLLTALLGFWAGIVGNKLIGPNNLRPNLNVVLFAGSSEIRKSTSIQIAGLPFKAVQKMFDLGFVDAYADYKCQYRQWDALSKKERLKAQEPDKPITTNIIIPSDFSEAGFYEIMKTNPVSGVIVATEFADYHNKLKRDYTGMIDIMLGAYDNERMSRQTRDHGSETIAEPTFSLLGATTFSNFRKVFSSTERENGSLFRIFPITITNPTKERLCFLDRKEVEDCYINKSMRQIKNWIDHTGDIQMIISDDLKAEFSEWESTFVQESKINYGKRIIPTIERMVPGCLKLAMLIEALEIEKPSKQIQLPISKSTFECSRHLVEDLLLPSMHYLLEEEIIVSREIRDEKMIIAVIKEKRGKASRTDLLRKLKWTGARLDDSINNLIEKSYIVEKKEKVEREQGGGSARTIYKWIEE